MIADEGLTEWSLRAARRANRIAAVGALIVICAFAVGVTLLFQLDHEVTERRETLRQTADQLHRVQLEKGRLLLENSQLKASRNQLKRVNQELEDTVRLQQSRQYLKAWEKLYAILLRDPENEVAHSYAAHSCFQLGRYKESIAYALRAIAIDRSYLDPYLPLVCAMVRSGNMNAALEHLNYILNENPGHYMAMLSRKRYFDELWASKQCRDAMIRHQQKLQSIQVMLRDQGYYRCNTCKIDALFGAETESAIGKFAASKAITNTLSVSNLITALSEPRP